MTLPNFLIIGAAKAGTTSLYHYLNAHRDIYMSPRKETNYFAYCDREPVVKGWGSPPLMILESITTLDQYKNQYEGVAIQKAIGEVSPLYLYSAEASGNIKGLIPDTKIVVILRNPVDRAYSHYMHLVRDRREPITEFSDAVEAENERMERGWTWEYYYTDMGFYYLQLTRYFELFDQSHIKVFLYEDLIEDTEKLMQNLFDFLNVDSEIDVDTTFVHNPSGVPRNRALHKLLSEPSEVKELVRRIVPEGLRSFIAQELWERNLRSSQVSSEMRGNLVQRFRADILKLELLIERDLGIWLE